MHTDSLSFGTCLPSGKLILVNVRYVVTVNRCSTDLKGVIKAFNRSGRTWKEIRENCMIFGQVLAKILLKWSNDQTWWWSILDCCTRQWHHYMVQNPKRRPSDQHTPWKPRNLWYNGHVARIFPSKCIQGFDRRNIKQRAHMEDLGVHGRRLLTL